MSARRLRRRLRRNSDGYMRYLTVAVGPGAFPTDPPYLYEFERLHHLTHRGNGLWTRAYPDGTLGAVQVREARSLFKEEAEWLTRGDAYDLRSVPAAGGTPAHQCGWVVYEERGTPVAEEDPWFPSAEGAEVHWPIDPGYEWMRELRSLEVARRRWEQSLTPNTLAGWREDPWVRSSMGEAFLDASGGAGDKGALLSHYPGVPGGVLVTFRLKRVRGRETQRDFVRAVRAFAREAARKGALRWVR